MPLFPLSDLPGLLAPGQCLLGLDPGSKIIGVAISDPGLRVASPLISLRRKKFAVDAASLASLVQERNVGGLVVVGLPKNMDGTEGRAAQAVRSFAANLLRPGVLLLESMPLAFWDERFSTAAVERFMIQDDMTRQRRREVIDKAAAAYILQGALDALCNAS